MSYVIRGLDPSPYRALFGLGDGELAKRNIVRMKVDAKPGFPCRVDLQDADIGETVLLINHVSRGGETPYRATHAIFVREGADKPATYGGELAPVLAERVLSMRGFDTEGMMIEAELAQPGEADAVLRNLFDNSSVDQVDIHNAVRGCFAARATRN